jgi:hypothetical protein
MARKIFAIGRILEHFIIIIIYSLGQVFKIFFLSLFTIILVLFITEEISYW